MIIDSHCHLTYEPMSNALTETIHRAINDGVKYMLTISTEDKSFNDILNIVSKYENVYGTYGIHPHEAKLHQNIKKIKLDVSKNIFMQLKKKTCHSLSTLVQQKTKLLKFYKII